MVFIAGKKGTFSSENAEDLKELRSILSSMRSEFNQYKPLGHYKHQAFTNVIKELYTMIKEQDDNYFGDDN